MFGKFGGIVIIALSVVIIAGLVLRTTPEHPAALSLGIEKGATVEEAPTTDDTATEAPAVEGEKTEEAEEVVSDTVEAAEEMKSDTVEAVKDTVTETVESTDEVISDLKDKVEKQIETKSE